MLYETICRRAADGFCHLLQVQLTLAFLYRLENQIVHADRNASSEPSSKGCYFEEGVLLYSFL